MMMRNLSQNQKWSIGFGIATVVVFLMNHFLFIGNVLPANIKMSMLGWLNPMTINEALVYAMMALGLNIVVGFAGLLDLGFVAFWAIGDRKSTRLNSSHT